MKQENAKARAKVMVTYRDRQVKYEMQHAHDRNDRREYARTHATMAAAQAAKARRAAWVKAHAQYLRHCPANLPGSAVRRAWEYDWRNVELTYQYGAVITLGVVKGCHDPQRRGGGKDNISYAGPYCATCDHAGQCGAGCVHTVSNSGCSPVMAQILRSIQHDIGVFFRSARGAADGTTLKYNHNGDIVTVKGDRDAAEAANTAARETVCSAADVVQHAVMALLDAADRCRRKTQGWLDQPVTIMRPVRRVIAAGRKPEFRAEKITLIQLVYRTVRRYIEDAGKIQDVSLHMYADAEGQPDDLSPMDRVYWRGMRYADLGGQDVSRGGMAGSPAGYPTGRGPITTDTATMLAEEQMIEKLALSARQERVLRKALAGDSLDTISDDLGVDRANISRTMRQIIDRWIACGFRLPAGWAESEKAQPSAARAVVQYQAGAEIARFASAKAAGAHTGINAGSIRRAAKTGGTAGGFTWRYV